MLQIGGVLKQTALPGRTSRDLVFDDEPTVPKIGKTEALAEAEKAYQSGFAVNGEIGNGMSGSVKHALEMSGI